MAVRRKGGVLTAVMVLLAGCGTGSPPRTKASLATTPTTSTPAPTTTTTVSVPSTDPAALAPWPSLVYVGSGVAVVGINPVDDPYGGQRPSELFLSTDMVHWTNVTPPQSQVAQTGTYGGFEHASFLNDLDGWVTTWNSATTVVTIYRTTDGGRSWSAVLGGDHSDGSDATVLINLVSPTTAFREALEPTGPIMTLQVSTDSGETWRTVYNGPPIRTGDNPPQGPFEMPMVFTDAERGFSSLDIPPSLPLSMVGEFFSTSDGGSTWTPETPPLPVTAETCPGQGAGRSTVSCLFALPTFSDTDAGVLPATVVSGAQASVAFDVTEDGGVHWTLRSQRSASVTPNDTQLPGVHFGYPFVSVASGSTWWLMGWTSTGVTTQVSADGGVEWATSTAPPFQGTPVALTALNATHALVTVQDETANGTTTQLWATADSGRKWSPCVLTG